jgi:hypothetical protein
MVESKKSHPIQFQDQVVRDLIIQPSLQTGKNQIT